MNEKLPPQSFPAGFGLPGTLLLLILILASIGLYWPVQEIRALSRNISETEAQLAELALLDPIHTDLLASAAADEWKSLPDVPRRPLSQAEVLDVPELFAGLATKTGMSLTRVRPRVALTDQGERHLHVHVEATGPYEHLQEYLLATAALPAMRRIDQVSIRRESIHEVVTVSLWLALE